MLVKILTGAFVLVSLALAPSVFAQTFSASYVGTQSGSCTFTAPISRGSSGSEVMRLQTILISQGFLDFQYTTGYFGPLTEIAVKAFQAQNNISAIGIVGPLTRSALSRVCNESVQAGTAVSVASGGTVAANTNCAISYDPNNPLSFLNIGTACTQSSNASSPSSQLSNGNASIYNGQQMLRVVTSDYLAGAVSAIFWNGKQFIYDIGHGASLQYAVSVGGLGEAYNPTEAGGRYDDYHLRKLDEVNTSDIFLQNDILLGPSWATVAQDALTTSDLQSFSTVGSVVSTKAKMAFWMAPGARGEYADGFPTHPAANQSKISDYVLSKTVRVGIDGFSNVVQMDAQLYAPGLTGDVRSALNNVDVYPQVTENQRSKPVLTIEAPTGYLLQEFDRHYEMRDPAAGTLLTDISEGYGSGRETEPYVARNPMIFATADGRYAMGIYAPANSQLSSLSYSAYVTNSGYSPNTSKWNVTAQTSLQTNPFTVTFKTYMAFGTVPEVAQTIHALYTNTRPVSSRPPASDLTIVRYHGIGTSMQWFMTADIVEQQTLGSFPYWVKDGNVGHLYSQGIAPSGTVPLLRFYNLATGDHFYTVEEADRAIALPGGYRQEASLGYVYPKNTTMSSIYRTPLYRAFNSVTHQHFYTANQSEFTDLINNPDWTNEGIEAYLPL